jgi:hypothetical protein
MYAPCWPIEGCGLKLPHVLTGNVGVIYSSTKDICATIVAENPAKVYHIWRGEEQFANARASAAHQIAASIS